MWRAIQLASPSRSRLKAVSHTHRKNHARNFRGHSAKRLRRCRDSLQREGIFRTYPAARKRALFRDCCPSASWLDFSAIAPGSNLTETGGEGGIRTPGTVLPVQRFSKAPLSATQPPLQTRWGRQTRPPQSARSFSDALLVVVFDGAFEFRPAFSDDPEPDFPQVKQGGVGADAVIGKCAPLGGGFI